MYGEVKLDETAGNEYQNAKIELDIILDAKQVLDKAKYRNLKNTGEKHYEEKNNYKLSLVAVIDLGVGAGTMASYKNTFTSEQNIVRAAKFNIDVNKGAFKDSVMTHVGKDLEPGKYVVTMNGSKGKVVFEAFEIK